MNFPRTCLTSLTLTALGTAAAQSAPQTYFGVTTLGAQVTYDTGRYALRLGAGGRSVLYVFANGVGLDAAVLFPVRGSLGTPSRFSLGVGLDANAYVSGFVPYSSGFNVYSLRPHALAQLETRLSPNVTFLAEGSLGYAFIPGGSGIVYPGVRVGLNFR